MSWVDEQPAAGLEWLRRESRKERDVNYRIATGSKKITDWGEIGSRVLLDN